MIIAKKLEAIPIYSVFIQVDHQNLYYSLLIFLKHTINFINIFFKLFT